MLAGHAGQGFGAFKPALAERLIAVLGPLRERFVELKKDEARIDHILSEGAARAEALGRPTLHEAYAALGLARMRT